MSRQAVKITLTASEQEQLKRWYRGHQTPRAMATRPEIVLLATQGLGNDEIARRLRCRTARVCKWRRRLAQRRSEGVQDTRRPGQPVKYGPECERRLLAQSLSPLSCYVEPTSEITASPSHLPELGLTH